MKLSVVSPVLSDMKLGDALKYLSGLGVEQLELGVGGYPGTAHADAKELIKSEQKVEELKALFTKYGMEISALAVHGNCIHPDKAVAAAFEADYEAACILAGKLGVDKIITFSGCAGEKRGKCPNWVTTAWPTEYRELLDWQWKSVLVPYWKKAAAFAKDNGVKQICLEMHPGFMVYNPETLLKLRSKIGNIIGANLDPSHLIWQGMNISEVISYLGDAVYYVHAKDTYLNKSNIAKNGVLDTKPYSEEVARSWIFRTVGYGLSDKEWRDVISSLRMIGYDGTLSIEHEDTLMTPREGLEKAINYLKEIMVKSGKTDGAWWI